MFGELVNKISNWVSSTQKTSNLFKKSVPQSIKRNIRPPINLEIAQKNDFIPVSTLHSKNLQTQITRDTFLNIRSKMEKKSVIHYTTPSGKWNNENSKAKINNPKSCHPVPISNEPEPSPPTKPNSPYKKCTKSSQSQKSYLIGDCSKNLGSSVSPKNLKKEILNEKNNDPSRVPEFPDFWIFSPPPCSHPVEAKELIKENLNEQNCISSKFSLKSSGEESKEKHDQLAKSRLISKEKSSFRDRTPNFQKSKEKKCVYEKDNESSQITDSGGTWLFSPPLCSHPVESKELIKQNLKEKNNISSNSSFKSLCEESKEKCHQLAESRLISENNSSFRDQTPNFETSKEIKSVYEKNNVSSQISDSGETWIFSPPLCSHPVESKELKKENLREQNSLSSKSSFKSLGQESKEKCHQLATSQLMSKEKSSVRDRSFKLEKWKKVNKGEYAKENPTSQILGIGKSWIFSTPPSSHPVEFKEFIQKNVKQQISFSLKSSFKSSCEESGEKCHQLAKSLPTSKEGSSARGRGFNLEKSKENKSEYGKENPPPKILGNGDSWIFSTPPSSHPVELKEFMKENLNQQISLSSKSSFKSSCQKSKEKCQHFAKSLPISKESSSARDRGLKLDKSKKEDKGEYAKENPPPQILGVGESWIFSTPPSSHPVEFKEFIKENLEQQNCLSSKPSFISSCEESKEKCHQFAKSLPISKEISSSHPMELKEIINENLKQENSSVRDRSLKLEKSRKENESEYAKENPSSTILGVGESWIFSTPPSSHPVEFKELNKENLKEENTSPPVFDFKTLCESCKNKPEKEVENKKSSKPERRPKYESKIPKIDLELGRKLTVHEAIESVPNITTHGSCYCRKTPKESNLLDITKLRPNSSAVKNHLSKCPIEAKILIADNSPANLQSEEKKCFLLENTVKVQKPKVRKHIPKYKASGDWKKQKYALQLRIYNCTTKYGDPRPLDPCRPILREVGCSQFKLWQK